MPLQVEKQIRESSQSLIRRFTQKLRRSGILIEVRKRRFLKKLKTGQLKKRSALRREEKKQEYKAIKKSGGSLWSK